MSDYQPPYDLDTLLNELPVSLAYAEDSNNAKLLSFFADSMVDVEQLLSTINSWRDIDNAQGKALDYYGEDHNVYRNGADDAFYRFMIKTKRLQRITDGTYNSLIKLVAESLDAKYTEINVNPMYDTDSKEPDAIEITNIPGDYINDTRKEQLLFDRLQESVAAGIRIANVEFIKTATGHIYLTGFAQTDEHDQFYMNGFFDESVNTYNHATVSGTALTTEHDEANMKGGA
ncbi:hypothetical protein FD12_GL001381 [Lentilactobacillus rapi DSM 19907 = JCM 15042]|uniref:Uncharacterized protein n=2 Tax=Lentilactobacillus rapi TaxID=481723 RepID=A0A512PLI8_9LACO|nr:hypothetical protein [Lentilactobacillus rapi]KRL17852.1 hypothetical protein FD12_GL001381 [Lentilactobacillus rapi DSM 19907 = JCM 15042]GEP72043.1 hypothetical protein LRA02_09110 [Lentilactobacillus rapi]